MVKLLDFVQSTLDKTTPHAVVLSVEDLSKAHNRWSHQLVVEDLHSTHLPGWTLAILCLYLSERSMVLSHQKAESTQRPLPGGFPAGTYLGGILFIVKFNGAYLRSPILRPLSGNKAILVYRWFIKISFSEPKKVINDRSRQQAVALQFSWKVSNNLETTGEHITTGASRFSQMDALKQTFGQHKEMFHHAVLTSQEIQLPHGIYTAPSRFTGPVKF